jgi:hypothetical protein
MSPREKRGLVYGVLGGGGGSGVAHPTNKAAVRIERELK